MNLYEKLLLKLIGMDARGTHEGSILDIDFSEATLQRRDEELLIGFATKQYIRAQDLEGTPELGTFYSDVCNFYMAVLRYMVKKFPLQDQGIKDAVFLNP